MLEEKNLLLVVSKLIEKTPDPHNAKELSIIYKKEKHKISKTKNNYSSAKIF